MLQIPDPGAFQDGGWLSQDGLGGGRRATDGGWLTGTDGGSMITQIV